MDLPRFLMQAPSLANGENAESFASRWALRRIRKGMQIIGQGEPETTEFIVLEGALVSRIGDTNGNEVCVGLYSGPMVITPNIARTRDGISQVTVQATTDTLVAQMDSRVLEHLMITSLPVRDWANGVLREELDRKSDREWCLAALGGSERLMWFRSRCSGYEDLFAHSYIASFLGMTPVTLSRLRSSAAGHR